LGLAFAVGYGAVRSGAVWNLWYGLVRSGKVRYGEEFAVWIKEKQNEQV